MSLLCQLVSTLSLFISSDTFSKEITYTHSTYFLASEVLLISCQSAFHPIINQNLL